MKIRTSSALLAAAGQVLILCLFLFVLPDYIFGELKVMWLDFVVLSIVYWLWVWLCIVPPVNMADSSSREVGGMGIKWTGVIWYSSLAVIVAAGCLLMYNSGTEIAFKWQIIIQAFLLFAFLLSVSSSMAATEKAGQMYRKEQMIKSGKRDIKLAIGETLAAAEDSHDVPADVAARLRSVLGETRFISPSSTAEATSTDARIADDCLRLRGAFTDYTMNKQSITELLDRLERDMSRRKSL